MEEGIGMTCFKFLKYETRNGGEKRQIEDTLVTKLGKWKYSPNDIVQKIPDELMQAMKPR